MPLGENPALTLLKLLIVSERALRGPFSFIYGSEMIVQIVNNPEHGISGNQVSLEGQ
jgi:hypothetical protein